MATSERIFNIFMYFDGGVASEFGARHYRRDESDERKLAFLREAVARDFGVAERFPLRRSFTQSEWLAHQRLGIDTGLFEEAFRKFRGVRAPLYCVTCIVDGEVRIDLATELEPFRGKQVGLGMPGVMDDWLVRYIEGDKLRIDKLINDDYFVAIRLLFNARHLASASKLLMSCIDTLAFIEFGDERQNFIKWLEAYVDLTPVCVSADELWEFRNSMVHMSNLNSRAVLAGKVSSIVPFIGAAQVSDLPPMSGLKSFNLYTLITALAAGIAKWSESYNLDREKFEKFVERYDLVVSDVRLATFPLNNSDDATAQR